MKHVVICTNKYHAEDVLAAGLSVGYTGIRKPLWVTDYKRLFYFDNGIFEENKRIQQTYNNFFNIEYLFTTQIDTKENFLLNYKTPEWLSNNLCGSKQIIYQAGSHSGIINMPRDVIVGVCADVYTDPTWNDFNGRKVWIHAKNTRDLWYKFTELTFLGAEVVGTSISDLSLVHTQGIRSDCLAHTRWLKKPPPQLFKENLATYSLFWEKLSYIKRL